MSSHDDTSFQELAHAVAQACGAPEFLRELEGLLARAEQQVGALSPACRACGGCCDFARAGHRLYATTGEIALLIARSPQPAGEVLPLHCAYQIGGACTARSGRPLGCRMFFCDEKTPSNARKSTNGTTTPSPHCISVVKFRINMQS